MKIAICGSIKFYDDMLLAKNELENREHEVFMPTKVEKVDYWDDNNATRLEAKKRFRFIDKGFEKIEHADAILVVNMTKNEVKNYIGANTFLEIAYAYYRQKKIYTLNPLPDQPYIRDELQTCEPVVINGDYDPIK